MKKVIPLFIVISMFFSCALLQELNKTLKKEPEAKIEKFDIESISFNDVTFLFDISINNPYPISLTLSDIKLSFNIDKKQLFKTSTQKGLNIKASGKEMTTFKVYLKYADIMNIVKNYAQQDYLDCEVNVDIIIPLPKAVQALKKNITFNYSLKKKIPAIKPSIRIVNFRIKKPSLSEVTKSLEESAKKNLKPDNVLDMFNSLISGKKTKNVIDPADIDLKLTVEFDIELNNSTKSELAFKELNYNFYINDSRLIEGKTRDISNTGSKSIISISNDFSSKALGKAVLSALNSKQGAYALQGYSYIKLPDSIKRDPLKLDFNEKGRFDIK